jgi:putative DNA primase/helicase
VSHDKNERLAVHCKVTSDKRAIRLVMSSEFAKEAQRLKERGMGVPSPSVSEDLVACIYGMTTSLIKEIPSHTTMPVWLDGKKADNVIVMENGVFDLDTRVLQVHTPQLFTNAKVHFTYDPAATCPQWQRFLQSLWDDAESVHLCQEFFGYLLDVSNWMQVFLLLQGSPRGGKGTLTRMVAKFIGQENTCAISIRNFASAFGLFGARGKRLIMIPDVRATASGLSAETIETLKAITGGDSLDINGKNRDITSEPIPAKIMAATNDLLEFNDDSGAFFDRMVALKFTKSFYPKNHDDYVEGQDQDPELETKLDAELAGIFVWAIDGRARLHQHKRFTQPAASLELKNTLREDGSPIKKFVSDCLVSVPDSTASVDEVFERWEAWCSKNSYEKGTKRTFGRLLNSALPALKRKRLPNGSRGYAYIGVELRNNAAMEI